MSVTLQCSVLRMENKRKGQVSKGQTIISFYKIAIVCLLYVLLCMRFLISFVPRNQPGSRLEELSLLKRRLEEAILERQNSRTNASQAENHFRFKRDINPHSHLNTTRNIQDSECNMHRYLKESAFICEQCDKYRYLYQTVNVSREYNKCDIKEVSGICSSLRRSYLFGKDYVTDEERSFPVAFAMKIHTHPNQAHRLLRLIYRSHNLYCIHIDKKAPALLFDYFKRIAGCLDNVILIKDRVSVVYSSIRQIEAEFKCVDAMLNFVHKWKYYINLTGQEFPLRTNLELVRILKLLNGSNEIESYAITSDKHKYELKTKMFKKIAMIRKERKPPFTKNITLRKGSAYGIVTREFLNFTRNDVIAKEFYDWLKDVYAPEEMFWATLNAFPNAPGGYTKEVTSIDFISRAVIWQTENRHKCCGRYVHWVCVFGAKDLRWLYTHRNIIANKFYEDYQPLALDCLEYELYRRTISPGGVGEHFNIRRYYNVTFSHSNNL